jgi:hypothetical protein
MLKGVEAEIGLACGVGMAVNGDHAAFFVELWVFLRGHGTGGRDQGRRNGVSRKLIGCIGDSNNPLEEPPGHANTSP